MARLAMTVQMVLKEPRELRENLPRDLLEKPGPRDLKENREPQENPENPV